MRNPFTVKKSLEYSDRRVGGDDPIFFEESLMDTGSEGTLERAGESRLRNRVLWFIILPAFVILFARLYFLTVLEHDKYLAQAEGNRLRVEYLAAPRGAVYDSQSKVIAGNKPSFELVASPLDLPKEQADLDAIVQKAAAILEIDPSEIKNVVLNKDIQVYQSVLVRQNISREQALIFQERAAEIPGLRVVNIPIRDYREPVLGYSHMLGYVGKINEKEYETKSSDGYLFNDSIGKTGLEQVYEKHLRGTFGERQVEVDARGIVKKTFGEKDPSPGNNIYLNIDAELEEKLYQSLINRLKLINRKKAAGLAMDPRSGRVLAYVSLPGYDNNEFASGISRESYANLVNDKNLPLFNRAIGGTYPPGSTVKPMVSLGALEEGVISERTTVDDKGSIVIPNIYGGPDSVFVGYNRSGLGIVDVRKAIALSSDIFFYIVGGGFASAKIEGLGIEKLAEYYRKFKIGEKLGIDLPGEAAGVVPDPEWKKNRFPGQELAGKWYLGDTYHVAIGQGDLLTTPLNVLSWTATIASDGKIFRPFIVDRVVDNDGQLIEKIQPQQIGELGADQANIKIVQEGMRETVVSGTAKSLNALPIEVAAKTGTAQFDPRDGYRTHAWFTAYAPFEAPEIAITVLIEDGGEGGVNSVPVVRETLDWWAKNRYNQ